MKNTTRFPELRPVPARARPPVERACDACGYLVIEFRPLDHCPMCGAVSAELVAAHAPAAASAA